MKPVTEPGVYDIPAEQYHADPVEGGSLSSTGARRLLDMPPARWKWEQEHPPAPTAAMILGTAVHSLVLGGPKVIAVDAPTWQGKAAKEARAAAQAAGQVALLRDEYDRAHRMADAVQSHKLASRIFSPARGVAEQTLVWRDEEFGIWRRAMVDHMPHPDTAGTHILADLKTTEDAAPTTKAVGKSSAKFGYHQQAAWYLDGYEALRGHHPAFVFVFVEKHRPHLVSVVELDQPALIVGRELNRRAMEIWRDCREAGVWPGHSPEIELVGLPAWATSRLEEPF